MSSWNLAWSQGRLLVRKCIGSNVHTYYCWGRNWTQVRKCTTGVIKGRGEALLAWNLVRTFCWGSVCCMSQYSREWEIRALGQPLTWAWSCKWQTFAFHLPLSVLVSMELGATGYMFVIHTFHVYLMHSYESTLDKVWLANFVKLFYCSMK